VVFLAEANVPNDDLVRFFGNADGATNRLQILFAFRLNEALMLSLAREVRRRWPRRWRRCPCCPGMGSGDVPAQP
jgi:maltose alpha-D-glucosyltransferase/alpha-amylase